jgi:multiple sugar transport system substrate-binding protein
MKNNLVKLLGVLIAVSMLLVACTPATTPAPTQPEAVATTQAVTEAPAGSGQSLVYDPAIPVNDGQPLTITYWCWHDLCGLVQSQIDDYMNVHPNITIELTDVPTMEYFTKMPLAMQADVGPDILSINTANITMQLTQGLMEPWPQDMANEYRNAGWYGIDSFAVDGKVNYVPIGLMTGMIFYNKTLWESVGLTEADIPTTWDQFNTIAEQLTKTDASGKITQSGFDLKGMEQYFYPALMYQKGEFLFSEDGKTANISTPKSKAVIQMIADWYLKDKVVAYEFTDWYTSFHNESAAMVYAWGWFGGDLRANAPEVDWGVFPLPSFVANDPARERYDADLTPACSPKSTVEVKSVCFDFLRFMTTNNDALAAFTVGLGDMPASEIVQQDPRVLADPVIQTTIAYGDKLVFPGEGPEAAWAMLISSDIFDPILSGAVPVDQAINAAQTKINTALAATGPYSNTAERLYKYADQFGK